MKKDTQKYVLGLGVLLGCFFTVSISTRAQTATGVSDKEILIGSCSALEGPSHFLGTETVSGAKAYFAMVNDAGGVDGRKLKLVAYDDSYDPAKTEACFNRLMEQKVFALGFFVGTPGREIHSDGGEQQDSSSWTFHRSADAICPAAALDCERSRLLFR